MTQDVILPSASLAAAKRRLEIAREEAQSRHEADKSYLSSKCVICDAILKITQPLVSAQTEISVDRWESPGQSTCANHYKLFPQDASFTKQEIILRRPLRQSLLHIYPTPQTVGRPARFEAPWEWFKPGQIIPTFSKTLSLSKPRLVDPHWIDLELFKGWLTKCSLNHQGVCDGGDQDRIEIDQILVIDVSRQCLVWRDTSSRYFALSYVWGRANKLMTTTKTLNQLQQPGSLGPTQHGSALPRTITQAIELTRALGEQFLWVDALSIVQDASEKHKYLNAMASIFANAVLTIVAAGGTDANAGFRGLPGISAPRQMSQQVAAIHPLKHLVKPISRQVWDDTLLEPWSTRAWTFQEGILSHRLLYLSHDSARWICRNSRWSEESNSPECLVSHGTIEQRQQSIASPHISASPLPSQQELETLVNGFNCRKFTFPEDALFAFAGVSAKLSRKFEYGLVSGLPALFFDLCLLWQPLRRLGPAVRRERIKLDSDAPLPSWSWAGWETEVVWPFTWNRTTDPSGPAPVILGTMRPFYQTTFSYASSSGDDIKIPSEWSNFAFSGEERSSDWVSHSTRPDANSDFTNQRDIPYFIHPSDASQQFWFPTPVSNRHWAPLSIDKVNFRGMVGQFRLGQVRRYMTQILTLDGTHAGTLWQHDEDDAEYKKALIDDMPIDLVAIIGCVVANDDHSWWDLPQASLENLSMENLQEPERTRQVYNVLWINRDGEVAYRKGSGEVDRFIWDKVVGKGETAISLG